MPKPPVDELTHELLASIQTTLGDELRGFYLFGSLITGDFDPKTSDIDSLAVVANDITDEQLQRLKTMHQAFVSDHPEWEDRIEVAYVGMEAMKNFKTKASRIARISPGESLNYRDMDAQWLLDWYVVQEQGVMLYGPPPKTFIPHIEQQEFVDLLQTNLPDWRDRVDEAKWKGYQSYIILSICRSLYAIHFGQQASKMKAAGWAAKEYPEWATLIANAVAWRGLADKSDSPETQAETRSFVASLINKSAEHAQAKAALTYIIPILKKYNFKWVITGGFACYAYGVPRKLTDIDIDIDVSKDSADFLSFLEEVKPYITQPLENFVDANYDNYNFELTYGGQIIDICPMAELKIFNEQSKQYESFYKNTFPKIETVIFEGFELPLLTKEAIIENKEMLQVKDEWQLRDIKELMKL